jgi:replicative DNA helicase
MILENLIANEDYSRKVLPFLKPEYFEDEANKLLFGAAREFINTYNILPSKQTLELEIKKKNNLKQAMLEDTTKRMAGLSDTPDLSKTPWMMDKTEQWCQERALFNAIYESIKIIDGTGKKTQTKTAIPQILSDALAVSFDSELGHDYVNDTDARYEFINSDVPRIPIDLHYYNLVMGGGVARKTLNLIGGGVNVGKTLHLCHFAAAYALAGYKVVYFTLEMAQEEIAKRIDANLLDIDINKLRGTSKAEWDSKVVRMKKTAKGNVVIKEYPTRGASVVQFKAFLRELKIKKNFVPDIICIDYIGICAAASMKLGGTINTNTYQGQIGAEIRALAKEYDAAIWSAQQLNREGFTSSDPDLNNTADSWDLAGIADFYLMITQSEELAKLNQYQAIQVKSRYGDKNRHKRFIVGVDKDHMRLYDVNPAAQTLTHKGNQQSGGTKNQTLSDRKSNTGQKMDTGNGSDKQSSHVFQGKQNSNRGKFNDFKL